MDNREDGRTLEMGSIEHRTRQTVYYEGDVDVGFNMIIHALGEASNVTVYNIDTREYIHIDTDKLESMTGSTIIYGDTINICTIKGQKSAYLLRDGVLTNILNCLGKTPDWFVLTKGDNVYGFTADEGEEYLDFTIEHKVAYEGA
jgi:hypothetical protein